LRKKIIQKEEEVRQRLSKTQNQIGAQKVTYAELENLTQLQPVLLNGE